MRLSGTALIRWGMALGLMPGLSLPFRAEAQPQPPTEDVAPSSDLAGDGVMAFDIPAQPLADALKRYGSLTRRPTLVRSELVAGRLSAPVRGAHTPIAALRRMLQGTGLQAMPIAGDAAGGFILRQAKDGAARLGALGELNGYPALVQTRVWQALCAGALTAPGRYRALLRLRVDAAGKVGRVALMTSTGDARRDGAILAALRPLAMRRPPPSGLAQPLTLLIAPQAGDACAKGGRLP